MMFTVFKITGLVTSIYLIEKLLDFDNMTEAQKNSTCIITVILCLCLLISGQMV